MKHACFYSLLASFVIAIILSCGAAHAKTQAHKKPTDVPGAILSSTSDLTTDTVSPDAVQLADQLNLASRFKQLRGLQEQVQLLNGAKAPADLREDWREAKEEIVEVLEQTRMEIDYTVAEIGMEQAGTSELLQAYTNERDKRVNTSNALSFRTNGVMWAAAEALDIPTYAKPRYSIPSGTIGILAGLVPSAFSLYAYRQMGGGHYSRDARPNMLSKLFDYPTTPRIDYPHSVWGFLTSVPANDTANKTRAELLIERWLDDGNLSMFTDRHSSKQLDLLTGVVQSKLTIELLSDRLTMLDQLRAVVCQMNRPLLELMLAVRGSKHF